MEKALASRNTPRSCSTRRCRGAVAQYQHQVIGAHLAALAAGLVQTVRPREVTVFHQDVSDALSKRISPPMAMICSRMFSTTFTSLNVPMWGWAT